jgi:cytochrome c-type biogenesis protein CcmH/NrfG
MVKKKSVSGHLKIGTAVIFACVTFVLGFLAGVVFTVYKSGPIAPATGQGTGINGTNLEEKGKRAMMLSLESEVEKNPENLAAWKQLGHLYFDNNQYLKAVHAYEKVIAIEPDNADVLTDLGVMYRRAGKPEKAIESFERAIATDPNHEIALFNKGIVLIHDLHDHQSALDTWETLLKINPLATAPNGQSVDELLEHYQKHIN